MKRIGNMYEQIYDWNNLVASYLQACKSKHSSDQERFTYNWELQLLAIQEKLKTESYEFGEYREFKIYEPKERTISCAPFKDRVVHHAIYNVVNPILDKSMIIDSYACRKTKGLHKAIKRAFYFYKNSTYHYRLDFRKYYYTIDHEILLSMLTRKFKDSKLLSLLGKLIATYHTSAEYYLPFPFDTNEAMERKRGLPIGNLTSQLMGNFYLSDLDHYIREHLHYPFYIRYMDDVLVFGYDQDKLKQARMGIKNQLDALRLHANPGKDYCKVNKQGVNFLGFRFVGMQIRLQNQNLVRLKRKLFYRSKQNVTDFQGLLQSINGHLGFLRGGHTKAIVNRVFDDIEFNSQKRKWKFILP